jgi:hypothetical protein
MSNPQYKRGPRLIIMADTDIPDEPTPPSPEDGPQYPVDESILEEVSHPVGEDDESSTE